mmetsp:Transcript_161184/g.517447  ORF Transcript_161184/g.517447 Transcript_161184/m.517447 type:complete len:383 (+) Transcript_161184:1234-2382(+)
MSSPFAPEPVGSGDDLSCQRYTTVLSLRSPPIDTVRFLGRTDKDGVGCCPAIIKKNLRPVGSQSSSVLSFQASSRHCTAARTCIWPSRAAAATKPGSQGRQPERVAARSKKAPAPPLSVAGSTASAPSLNSTGNEPSAAMGRRLRACAAILRAAAAAPPAAADGSGPAGATRVAPSAVSSCTSKAPSPTAVPKLTMGAVGPWSIRRQVARLSPRPLRTAQAQKKGGSEGNLTTSAPTLPFSGIRQIAGHLQSPGLSRQSSIEEAPCWRSVIRTASLRASTFASLTGTAARKFASKSGAKASERNEKNIFTWSLLPASEASHFTHTMPQAHEVQSDHAASPHHHFTPPTVGGGGSRTCTAATEALSVRSLSHKKLSRKGNAQR